MDVDRFLLSNQPAWARLDDLTARAGRGVRHLTPSELDELVMLYQRASTHLSYTQTYLRDPALSAVLSRRVARAAAVIYGVRPRTWRALGAFFAFTFPAAVWHCRRAVAVSAALFFVPALVVGLWLGTSARARDATGSETARRAYVERDFADYYRSEPAAAFASEVFVNNVGVAILAFAVGVALCLPTAYVLVTNGAQLGAAAGLFTAAGRQVQFWGLVIPHGLLELTSVCVAGAAGLRLGWALVDPGDQPRATALAAEGRRAVVIVVGLIVTFGVAGIIEGFVTGSGLPTAMRVGIGVVAEGTFVSWIVVRGRAAASMGLTGALGEDRGDRSGMRMALAPGAIGTPARAITGARLP
ncbi:MAG: stage II sporulation protein M [Acidimicrobiales bacterium]